MANYRATEMDIPIGKNKLLVIEKNYYEGSVEMRIYIQEISTGVGLQNVALIRNSEKSVECLIWGDANNEDFTDRFIIDF